MTTKEMMEALKERLTKLIDLYDVIDAVKDNISELNDSLYDATTTLESAMADLDSVMDEFKREED